MWNPLEKSGSELIGTRNTEQDNSPEIAAEVWIIYEIN
jgi:hypothetical protein